MTAQTARPKDRKKPLRTAASNLAVQGTPPAPRAGQRQINRPVKTPDRGHIPREPALSLAG